MSGDRYQTPEWILDGFPDEETELTNEIYDDFNEEHETNYQFRLK